MFLGLVFSVLVVGIISTTSAAENPTVKTQSGLLKGIYLNSRNGNPYEAYLGIRFATVSARFENSVLDTAVWEGTKDATGFGTVCAQKFPGLPPYGEDDCLYLNVFTPKIDNKKRPVIVYIHGGGFVSGGTSLFGVKYFMDDDVVMVTISYRLGIFGFLSTGDEVVTGNMGLRDQVQALRWVQENIEAFGGDPSKVTISGTSAGSASVSFLVLSPLAKGLFHKAIANSGAATNPWAFRENTVSNTLAIAQKLGCNAENSIELVECLRGKTYDELLDAQSTLAKFYIDPIAPFSPTLETRSELNPEPFLDRHPIHILESGDFNRVPIIFIVMKDEGIVLNAAIVLRNEVLRKQLDEEWSRVAPITFLYDDVPGLSTHINDISKELRQFYFGNAKINLDNEQNLTNLYTDSWFFKGIHDTAHHMAKHVPVYTGLFTHQRNDFSVLHLFGINEFLGVSHGEDIAFLFSPEKKLLPEGALAMEMKDVVEPEDVEMSKLFIKIVTSFAVTGIPEVVLPNSPKWTPVTKQETALGGLNWFNVGLEPFLHVNPFKTRMEFWDRIYKKQDKKSGKSEL